MQKSILSLELADLYFQRWDVELDFRHLKTTMQMDVLRCKSPEMVRKELWCHLLAYNLIRHVMWEAGQCYQVSSRRISVKGTIQYLLSFRVNFRTFLWPYAAVASASIKNSNL
jgi:hypothetical protein